MTVREVTAADAALVHELIERHPFKPFRNHRFLSRRQQADVLRAEVDRVRSAEGHFCRVTEDEQGAVVVTARPLPWDSTFFNLPMGRIEQVLRHAGTDVTVLHAALDDVLARLRQTGVKHVALKADVADHELIAAAEHAGFRLMDAIVTYIAHPRRSPPRPPKNLASVRPFSDSDTEQILEITREAYRGYRGRFQLDPHLPSDKSEAFYLEWARNCCAGAMADRIFVAEDAGGRVIGWASVKRAEPASSVSGAVISAGSLGACRSDSPGAYASLITTAARENHAAGILTEASTQSSNFAMVRVLEAVGAQYARAEYTFHAWLA